MTTNWTGVCVCVCMCTIAQVISHINKNIKKMNSSQLIIEISLRSFSLLLTLFQCQRFETELWYLQSGDMYDMFAVRDILSIFNINKHPRIM